MKVKELFDSFVCEFNRIVIFEDDRKVEDFLCNPNSRCLKKYGNRTILDWYYNYESNEININMDTED